MASRNFAIRASLGLIPSAAKIEYRRKKLNDEFGEMCKYENSDEYKDYLNLDEFINSEAFKVKKSELLSLNFKNTESFEKEERFLKLKKSKKIINYFKVLNSAGYQNFIKIEKSEILEKYLTLEKDSLNAEKKRMLVELKASNEIKSWNKFKKSNRYKLFLDVKNSSMVEEYTELDKFVSSEKFVEYKKYMLDKDKYKNSEEAIKENRYLKIKKSKRFKNFARNISSSKFDVLKLWNLTFEEDFNEKSIIEKKWANDFLGAKALINDGYGLLEDKHFYTKNKNIELIGNTAKLTTKNEEIVGKVWHPDYGFYKRKFKYSSAMLNTANSFRQQYGKFEAKIKVSAKFPVYQTFWMKGEKIVPQIDIFRFNMYKKNRLGFVNHWGNTNDKSDNSKHSEGLKIKSSIFSKKFFIYSLEWSPEKIKWLVNDEVVFETTKNIPSEPMYIILSAGITKDTNGKHINSSSEIDWVRCYEKNE